MNIDEVKNKYELNEWLKNLIQKESFFYYGLKNNHPQVSYAIQYFSSHDLDLQQFRFSDLEKNGVTSGISKNIRILDMASGFGQFVIAALLKGYDIYGLEPDKKRLDYIFKKIELNGFDIGFKNKFFCGIGEDMPFPSDFFDYITSFQTLEHVQNINAVIKNMLRVIKSGGTIHIRCPNYTGTYEGHYLLPWLPKPIPNFFMRLILIILRRPTRGLDETINCITKSHLVNNIYLIASQLGLKVFLIDNLENLYKSGLRARNIPIFPGSIYLVQVFFWFKHFMRSESSIDISIRVIK